MVRPAQEPWLAGKKINFDNIIYTAEYTTSTTSNQFSSPEKLSV